MMKGGGELSVDGQRPALIKCKALVIGLADGHSVAYGCAKAFRELTAVRCSWARDVFLCGRKRMSK
jgi:hypothetical protein